MLSVSVLAQLRRGLHIRLIFVKCWEKTSLHSLSHRGCHCRTPPARRCSHPSQTHAHLQQRGTVAPSAKWGCIFLHICHISMQCIFKFLTKKITFSASDLPRLGFSLAPLSPKLAQERRHTAAPNSTTARKAGPVSGQGLARIEQEVGLECPV